MDHSLRLPDQGIHLSENPFRSFWMAGFECTDKLNAFGNRVDFLLVTDHLRQAKNDYQLIQNLDMTTVREGIRWSVVEKSPYQYDWAGVQVLLEAAAESKIQIVWDLSHFGYPDDLTPLHPMFARRFAALCTAFVRFYRSIDPASTLIVTPFNEVSFISWLGGEVCGTVPYCRGYGWEVKYALMKAYIEGIEALLKEDPGVRILATEPLVNIVAPANASPEEYVAATKANLDQFQVFDILSGRECPELGGKPEYLDIIGCNFYFNNQWAIEPYESISWKNENNDPRWLPLSQLILHVHKRYGRPIILAETSHPGSEKPEWIKFITDQCRIILESHASFWGICWYPIIDRPDWDHLEPWTRAGVWDVDSTVGMDFKRVTDEAAFAALRFAQAELSGRSLDLQK